MGIIIRNRNLLLLQDSYYYLIADTHPIDSKPTSGPTGTRPTRPNIPTKPVPPDPAVTTDVAEEGKGVLQ